MIQPKQSFNRCRAMRFYAKRAAMKINPARDAL